jgi:hypothetical protein
MGWGIGRRRKNTPYRYNRPTLVWLEREKGRVVSLSPVVARIEAVAENSRPAGVTKLQGEANAGRIRVGDYRVLYTIEDGLGYAATLQVVTLTLTSVSTCEGQKVRTRRRTRCCVFAMP